jgi:hypothetical protein
MRVTPDVEVLMQDQKPTPKFDVIRAIKVPEYMESNQYLASLVCGLLTLFLNFPNQTPLKFLPVF